MSALLEARLTVGYGHIVVGRDIDLRVAAGEICAIIGPNGAGKTTLLNTIAGLLPPIEGSVTIGSERIPGGAARRASRAGLALVPDHRALFTRLTTLENLRAADRTGGHAIEEMFELFPPLETKAKLAAGRLSGGEQQMLALARAFVQRPRVLLIDEMSMGLAPIVVQSLAGSISKYAAATGAAVVLVEQHVPLALASSDHALVLVHGDVVLQGPSDEVSAHPELGSMYLGGGPARPFRTGGRGDLDR